MQESAFWRNMLWNTSKAHRFWFLRLDVFYTFEPGINIFASIRTTFEHDMLFESIWYGSVPTQQFNPWKLPNYPDFCSMVFPYFPAMSPLPVGIFHGTRLRRLYAGICQSRGEVPCRLQLVEFGWVVHTIIINNPILYGIRYGMIYDIWYDWYGMINMV